MTVALPAATEQSIDAAANRHGVAPELLRAVAWVESRGKQSAVSKKGAIGVMQLMPDTAAGLGVNPRDESQNIDGGARLLASLVHEFGERNALAAYNWGEGQDGSTHRAHLLSGQWPAETAKYVRDVEQARGGGSDVVVYVLVAAAVAVAVATVIVRST